MVEAKTGSGVGATSVEKPLDRVAARDGYVDRIIRPAKESVATIAIAIGAGIVTFFSRAEELVHKNLSTLYVTEDLKEKRAIAGKKIAEKAARGLDTQQSLKDEYIKLGEWFESSKDARFTKTGFGTFTSRLETLRPHQWREVVFQACMAGVGSIIAIDALKDAVLYRKDRDARLQAMKDKDFAAQKDQGVQR